MLRLAPLGLTWSFLGEYLAGLRALILGDTMDRPVAIWASFITSDFLTPVLILPLDLGSRGLAMLDGTTLMLTAPWIYFDCS